MKSRTQLSVISAQPERPILILVSNHASSNQAQASSKLRSILVEREVYQKRTTRSNDFRRTQFSRIGKRSPRKSTKGSRVMVSVLKHKRSLSPLLLLRLFVAHFFPYPLHRAH